MKKILIAGYGGQGILFTGKVIAQAKMHDGKQVTWMPSYGPEMRGGTTNCGVIVSDTLIGSPVFLNPDMLLCLNGPSTDKFESRLTKGGIMFIDSTLCKRKVDASINAFYIPATQMAFDHKLDGLGNMIVLGKALKETGLFDMDTATEAMKECVSERHQDMVEANIKALALGMAYAG
jgi:2-oxoglutarate ferredoxin oxidoreductase subunit gamma